MSDPQSKGLEGLCTMQPRDGGRGPLPATLRKNLGAGSFQVLCSSESLICLTRVREIEAFIYLCPLSDFGFKPAAYKTSGREMIEAILMLGAQSLSLVIMEDRQRGRGMMSMPNKRYKRCQ